MKKSNPLCVMAPAPSPAPDVSFLFNDRRPWIMGVLNVTPDSFYDGGRYAAAEQALARAEEMIREGADVLDIGGESTRPGALEVSLQEESVRVLPLVEMISSRWPDIPISVDTRKASVAREALERGAALINDISALRHDPEMAQVLADFQAPVILMHMRETPATMQKNPRYSDVVGDIERFFEERLTFAARHGISEERIILDPGIGFGKTVEHNLTILKRLSEFLTLGRPLLVGVSRKSFLGRILRPPPCTLPLEGGGRGGGETTPPPEERLEGSLAAGLWAIQQGARVLRVHDVAATRRALAVWGALQ